MKNFWCWRAPFGGLLFGRIHRRSQYAYSSIFDNSKVRRLVPDFRAKIPFWQGAKEIIAWYDADPSRQVSDPYADGLQDQLIRAVAGADIRS